MNALVVAYLLRRQMSAALEAMPVEAHPQRRRHLTVPELQIFLRRLDTRVKPVSESLPPVLTSSATNQLAESDARSLRAPSGG